MLLHGHFLYVYYFPLLLFLVECYWLTFQGTRGIYTLRLSGEMWVESSALKWEFSHSGEIVQTPAANPRPAAASPSVVPVKRVRLSAALSFKDIIAQGRPVVLEGLDIGPCTSKWSLDHLTNEIGQERKVRRPDCIHRP